MDFATNNPCAPSTTSPDASVSLLPSYGDEKEDEMSLPTYTSSNANDSNSLPVATPPQTYIPPSDNLSASSTRGWPLEASNSHSTYTTPYYTPLNPVTNPMGIRFKPTAPRFNIGERRKRRRGIGCVGRMACCWLCVSIFLVILVGCGVLGWYMVRVGGTRNNTEGGGGGEDDEGGDDGGDDGGDGGDGGD
jgi:hypothetical protein